MKCFTFPLSGIRKEAGDLPVAPGGAGYNWHERFFDPGPDQNPKLALAGLAPSLDYAPDNRQNFQAWANEPFTKETYPSHFSDAMKKAVRNHRRLMLRDWADSETGAYIGPRGEHNAYFKRARQLGLLPEQLRESMAKTPRSSAVPTGYINANGNISGGTRIVPIKYLYDPSGSVRDGNWKRPYKIVEFDGRPVKWGK